MKIVPIAEVKAHLSAYVNQIETESPIIITRNGKTAAVLVAPSDADLDWILLSNSPRLQAILERSRKSIAEGRGIPHEEFWRQVEERQGAKLAVAEKQAEYKTKKARRKNKKEAATSK